MPTVMRWAGGRFEATSWSAPRNVAGGIGYGVGMRNRLARIVPASSSTEPLMPEPPQSIARVCTTATSWLMGDLRAARHGRYA